MSKSKELVPKKKVDLGLLQHTLGNIYTRSFMAGYNATVWHNIDLRIDPDPFFTSWKISSMKKRLVPIIH